MDDALAHALLQAGGLVPGSTILFDWNRFTFEALLLVAIGSIDSGVTLRVLMPDSYTCRIPASTVLTIDGMDPQRVAKAVIVQGKRRGRPPGVRDSKPRRSPKT